jgi:hypothetical protein
MTKATIATEVHQPLNVHGHFPSQITLDIHLGYQRAKLIQLTL